LHLQVVSSAIVDKYIGESARLIREMFGYAKEHQPCIIFMDEIDAIGGRRFSEGTSADREIQRTLMELLSQLDGFDAIGKVKMIMATNRSNSVRALPAAPPVVALIVHHACLALISIFLQTSLQACPLTAAFAPADQMCWIQP
jgi:ATPase family associated with various cellular activities (AAA)